MSTLDETALVSALDTVDEKEPAVRLLVAIAHANGVSQTDLAEWIGVERKTVYNWLVRFRESPEDPVAAARDEDRPGRPSKLSETARTDLQEQVRRSPRESGHDRATWTPALLQEHVEDVYGVTYSLGSCRRLLCEAGLEYRRPDPGRDDRSVDATNGGRLWLPKIE